MTASFLTDPTVEKMVSVGDATAAIESLIGETFPKAGESRDELEG